MLLIITLIAGIALGATYALTKDPIADQARIQAENARKAALPDADAFEELALPDDAAVDWAYQGLKDGEVIGCVAQKTVKGFGGEVEVIAGVDTRDRNALTLGGISVGGSGFSETAGLGARAREKAFTDQFAGKALPVKYIKAGEEAGDDTVDALTSATITTTAVVNGVNDIVKYVKSDVLGIAGVEMPARPGDDQVFSSSAQGFRGPVYVEAAFGQSGEVSYISVGDDSFAEDIGAGAREPDFMIQFIGKTAPVELSDVDALAGATITTNAVITALNEAYALSQGGEIPVKETAVLPEKPADAQVYSASSPGFRGPVYVEAAFSDSGEITYISVGDDSFAEDIGAGAREPDFMIQFIGKTAPVELSDVDALTGATITTNAVITALNEAYDAATGKSAAIPAAAEAKETPLPTEAPTAEPSPAITQAPAPAPTAAPVRDADGGYAGESIIFFDSIRVSAGFDGNVISSLNISMKPVGGGDYAPLPNEHAYQEQLIGKSMPLDIADVHAGTAYMDQAVLTGIALAYAQVQPADGPTDAPAAVPEAPAANGIAVGESLVFFTEIRAEAAFDGDALGDFALLQRAVGTEGWEPMDEEQAYLEVLYGQAMPLDISDVTAGGSAYMNQAVMIALNQAYARQNPDMELGDGNFPIVFHSGSCIIFFSEIRAEAAFDGDTIAVLNLSSGGLGDAEYVSLPQEEAFQAVLTGETVPLDAAQVRMDDVDGYIVNAVVIAVNQAYENSLAGQQ